MAICMKEFSSRYLMASRCTEACGAHNLPEDKDYRYGEISTIECVDKRHTSVDVTVQLRKGKQGRNEYMYGVM
jgi:hypothetical protein